MSIRSILLLSVSLTFTCGCTKEGKLFEVTGIATHSGKPVRQILVHFCDETGGAKGGAITDADGRFTLLSASGKPGIEAGTYRVWVSMPNTPKEDSEGKKMNRSKSSSELAELFQKYGNVSRTPKTVEIKDKQEIQLELD